MKRLPKVKIDDNYYFRDDENKVFIDIHTPWIKIPFSDVKIC